MKRTISAITRGLLGRRHTARLGRFLYNEACLSSGNDPATNGELLVQDYACAWAKTTAPPFTVVDVGANVGEWSREFSKRLSAAGVTHVVHAFEPFPETYATLSRNLTAWNLTRTVRTHNLALSSAGGEHEFFSLGSGIGQNSLHPIPEAGAGAVRTTVTRTTLDDTATTFDISTIHVMKIDTEGHDLEVLIGAKTMLESGRIRLIQFEYNHRWIMARRYLRDAFELLMPLGYRIGMETRLGVEYYDRWLPELESFRENNFLAAKGDDAALFPVVRPWMV
ncbi:MAG TPA: FkbM family methyltransferase [Fimbriiglobus sp.]|jgi:FkbM family methyltransferase